MEAAFRGQGPAPQCLQDYMYRKEMGLSYEEFMNEPIHVYKQNLAIMRVREKVIKQAEDIRERMSKQASRRSLR